MERYTRLAPSGTAKTDAATRTVDYIISDESVGRDGHIVKNSAWQLENFLANPICLWCHDDKQPPIGRVFNLRVAGGAFRGSVRYAETPFADTIYGLVRDDFLSAVSASWQPIAYDRRPNGEGLIFRSVDLLEVSQVALPALPTALATARSRCNLRPLYDWASQALETGLSTLDRPLLEAVCRAARPLGTRKAATETVEDRVRRAREVQTKGRVIEDVAHYARYRRLRDELGFTVHQAAWELGMTDEDLCRFVARVIAQQTPGGNVPLVADFPARKFSANDRSKLRGTSRHLAKAQRHHSALEDHHDDMGERIRDAGAAHRVLTSTLKELGEQSVRTTSTLAALGYDHHEVTRAMKQMSDALDALRKVHGDAEDVAGQAQDSVRSAAASVDGLIGSGSDEGTDEVH